MESDDLVSSLHFVGKTSTKRRDSLPRTDPLCHLSQGLPVGLKGCAFDDTAAALMKRVSLWTILVH